MKNYLRHFLFIFCGTMFVEILFKLFAFHNFFDLMIIRVLLFTLAFSMLFSLFLSFLKTKYSKIIVGIYIFFIGLMGIVQLTFNKLLGNYMSFKAGEGLGRIGEFVGEFLKTMNKWHLLLLLPFIFFLISIIFFKKKIKKQRGLRVAPLITIFLLGIGIHTLSISTLKAEAFNS